MHRTVLLLCYHLYEVRPLSTWQAACSLRAPSAAINFPERITINRRQPAAATSRVVARVVVAAAAAEDRGRAKRARPSRDSPCDPEYDAGDYNNGGAESDGFPHKDDRRRCDSLACLLFGTALRT
jgi:hypothetical protein